MIRAGSKQQREQALTPTQADTRRAYKRIQFLSTSFYTNTFQERARAEPPLWRNASTTSTTRCFTRRAIARPPHTPHHPLAAPLLTSLRPRRTTRFRRRLESPHPPVPPKLRHRRHPNRLRRPQLRPRPRHHRRHRARLRRRLHPDLLADLLAHEPARRRGWRPGSRRGGDRRAGPERQRQRRRWRAAITLTAQPAVPPQWEQA